MSVRTILPMLGGVAGIFVARSNDFGVIETFGLVIAGMAIGWGLNRLLGRISP